MGGEYLNEIPSLTLDKNTEIEDESKLSKNEKRSPLELGFVSFELDHRRGRQFAVPAFLRQNSIPKKIPILSKSRMITTTSTVKSEKGPNKGGDHVLFPADNDHVIIPLINKIHGIHPKIIIDHKELLVDHAAEIILDQKHLILEQSPQKSHMISGHSDQRSLILEHPNTHTVIFEHKPVLVDHSEHGTNVLIHHSAGKTMILDHKPVAMTHPHQPKTVVLGSSRTIVISPKNKIHEIIVHRHVPKGPQIHGEIGQEERNIFRSHFGGFGVGMDYGGHGAGHGYHVPFI